MTTKEIVDFQEWKNYNINTDLMKEEVSAWFYCYVQEKGITQGDRHTMFNACIDDIFLDSSHTFSRDSVKELAFRLTWKVYNSETMINYAECQKEDHTQP